MFAYMTKLLSKLDFMLLIIWTVFLFPVSQIYTLVSIRRYFPIYLRLFCVSYSGFSVFFSGSFISNLSCYLVNVFQSFNYLWKHFLWICQICTRDALVIIEFQVYWIFTLALKYVLRQIQRPNTFCMHPVAQSCPILCDPMDYTLPEFSVREISQARILEWVAISYGML